MAGAVLGQFASVRAQLEEASRLLMSPSPEALDRCAAMFESAVAQITTCNSQLVSIGGNRELVEAAHQVRSLFLRVRRLMENAARFHSNWLSIRGTITGGYTERGEPAPIRHVGRICIEA